MTQLPEIGQRIKRLPVSLTLVRELEAFEGPILSEHRGRDGSRYLEKWCARSEGVVRTLVVRTDQRSVAKYLARRMTLLEALTKPNDDVGFIVDWSSRGEQVSIVEVSSLPQSYLPKAEVRHYPSLRPHWDRTPQSFLVDEWDAGTLARVERAYLDAYAFSLFSDRGRQHPMPEPLLSCLCDGGFPIVQAFRMLRTMVPRADRARTVGVFASSPGVLTIEAPTENARRVTDAVSAVAKAAAAYHRVHSWSRLKPHKATAVPDSALQDLRQLCSALHVDLDKLASAKVNGDAQKKSLLIAGKLVTAYFRKLAKLSDPRGEAEFLGVNLQPNEIVSSDDDEEDKDEDGYEDDS